LNGQYLTMTLPLQDTVNVIKSRLNDELGMPPGKQKLQFENIFLKDSNTLGFYNVTPGEFYLLIFTVVKDFGYRTARIIPISF
jgi:splicing factor 3A subunit 1